MVIFTQGAKMKSVISQEETKHPYIIVDQEIGGGSPIVKGTRTKVIDIAVRYELMGFGPDQIIEQYPHLTLAQIHDALSYYFDHKTSLDKEYRENQEVIEELKKLYPSKVHKKLSRE